MTTIDLKNVELPVIVMLIDQKTGDVLEVRLESSDTVAAMVDLLRFGNPDLILSIPTSGGVHSPRMVVPDHTCTCACACCKCRCDGRADQSPKPDPKESPS